MQEILQFVAAEAVDLSRNSLTYNKALVHLGRFTHSVPEVMDPCRNHELSLEKNFVSNILQLSLLLYIVKSPQLKEEFLNKR